VRSSQSLWQAWTLSQAIRSRPSDVFRIEEEFGPYVAYCFDNAVVAFGRALEAELDSVEGKTGKEINRKRDRVLRKWLDMPLKFRNPGGPTAPSPNRTAK
jgi:hypothetical protein